MAKSFAGLKSFGSKAVSVIASGALALSLTPAIALASPGTGDLQAQSTNLLAQHYEYINTSGKAVVDMLNGKVKKVVSDDVNHVYQYMGYVHSDGQHYVPYSLYTKITTDSDGVITALDISSGNDTFGGKWGYKADGSSAAVIEGYLPDGVEFTAQENSDGMVDPDIVYVPSQNELYLNWAIDGKFGGTGYRMRSVVAQIQEKIASGAAVEGISTVSGATRSSRAIVEAYGMAAENAAAGVGRTAEEAVAARSGAAEGSEALEGALAPGVPATTSGGADGTLSKMPGASS